MLSYLKQQNNEAFENNKGEPNKARQDAKSMVSSSNKNAKRSTYFLCLLFIVGIAALFYMIRESSPHRAEGAGTSGAGLRQARIEAAIKKFSGAKVEMSEGIDKVIKKFNKLKTTEQVGVKDLKKNPFVTDSTADDDVKSQGQNSFDTEVLKKQEIRRKAGQLNLSSIMETGGGEQRSCIIDDEIYRRGNSIKGFEIIEIGSEHVVLRRDGVDVMLHLGTGY